ncbi:MAG: nucleoside-triphosphatase [Lachnospiraceae bacterium]
MNNILITGQPGSGKSTLVRRLVRELQQVPYGYCTVRRHKYIDRKMAYWGFWMTELPEKKSRCEISRVYPGSRPECFAEAFETFGVRCLLRALELTKPGDLVIMDEVGRFEAAALQFQKEIDRVLDSDRLVLAVLKKEPIPFHEKIKQRTDAILVDLDLQNREEVLQEILERIER